MGLSSCMETVSRRRIMDKPCRNAEVVGLEVSEAHPWMKFAGMFKNDPLFEDWQKAIAEYRRKVNEDPDYL